MAIVAETILVVDDDPPMLAVLFHALSLEGFQVIAASSGQEAIDLIDRGLRPRLVMVDLVMPRLSGHDLIRYMRSDITLRHIPVIVVTGLPKEQVSVVADAVFVKPVNLPALMALVWQILHKTTGSPAFA